jgi:hypothetical protein
MRPVANFFQNCLIIMLLGSPVFGPAGAFATPAEPVSQAKCSTLMALLGGLLKPTPSSYLNLIRHLAERSVITVAQLEELLSRPLPPNPLEIPSQVLSPIENRAFRYAFNRILSEGGINWPEAKKEIEGILNETRKTKVDRGETAQKTRSLFVPLRIGKVFPTSGRHLQTDPTILRDGRAMGIRFGLDPLAPSKHMKPIIVEFPAGIERPAFPYPSTNELEHAGQRLLEMRDGRVIALVVTPIKAILTDASSGTVLWERKFEELFKDTPLEKANHYNSSWIEDFGKLLPRLLIRKGDDANSQFGMVDPNTDQVTMLPNYGSQRAPGYAMDRFGSIFLFSPGDAGKIVVSDYADSPKLFLDSPEKSLYVTSSNSKFHRNRNGDFISAIVHDKILYFSNLSKGFHRKFETQDFNDLVDSQPVFHDTPNGKTYLALAGGPEKTVQHVFELTGGDAWTSNSLGIEIHYAHFLTRRNGTTLLIGTNFDPSARRLDHLGIMDLDAGSVHKLDLRNMPFSGTYATFEMPDGTLQTLMMSGNGFELLQVFGPLKDQP